jgi:hypothetical protein|uniref:Uncharacterized protein n=1 Tax=viral metagenome TaxID=1070528 RepID=A0A6C0DXK9_9ZZZZ
MDFIVTTIVLQVILVFGGIGWIFYLIRNQEVYIQGMIVAGLLYLFFVYYSFSPALY